MVFRSVHFGVVGLLVGHRNAGQLIKFPPLAILRCIRGKVERKVEVRGGEMQSLQQLVPNLIERSLLLGALLENGKPSAQNRGHGLRHQRIVANVTT